MPASKARRPLPPLKPFFVTVRGIPAGPVVLIGNVKAFATSAKDARQRVLMAAATLHPDHTWEVSS